MPIHILQRQYCAAGDLSQSHVCPTEDEVFEPIEQWEPAMSTNGWTGGVQ